MAAAVRCFARQKAYIFGVRGFVRPSMSSRIVLTSSSTRFMSGRVIDPPYLGPPVPNYRVREGESVQTKRSRLLYQSRKRGMLENGLLLSTFAQKYLKDFDEESLELYDKLINQPSNDWDLYHWMTENQPTPEEFNNSVMDLLKQHAKNEQRDVRLRQPDLDGV